MAAESTTEKQQLAMLILQKCLLFSGRSRSQSSKMELKNELCLIIEPLVNNDLLRPRVFRGTIGRSGRRRWDWGWRCRTASNRA